MIGLCPPQVWGTLPDFVKFGWLVQDGSTESPRLVHGGGWRRRIARLR